VAEIQALVFFFFILLENKEEENKIVSNELYGKCENLDWEKNNYLFEFFFC
jgi:hypothetical protein